MKKSSLSKSITLATAFSFGALFTIGAAYANDAPATSTTDKISLLQAVSLAQSNTGATAFEVERESEMGQAFYEIELVGTEGQTIYTAIHSETGEVLLTKERRSRNKKHHKGNDDQLENALWLSGLNRGLYLSVEDVVKQAQAQYDATAYSIELEDEDDALIYEIELVNAAGKEIEVEINAHIAAK
ncbi:PepSY domain-containing protein [Ferrimonas lipolytica]|uniref:PepSY domain-containing protein n=1 Tax=Ferrimonas lipolytica TaxID=2724191 RepID=A0A6H1UF99_9GAMM|nr:PepSY domain-containing protein [Ferrimonas lipolytica]QIZ76472.1 hypothetical protein HER31_06105 [Ferrimonas lipolytica]